MSFRSDLNNYASLMRGPVRHPLLRKLWVLLAGRGFWLLTFYRFRYAFDNRYCRSAGVVTTILKTLLLFLEFLVQIISKSQLHHCVLLKERVYLSNRGNMVVGALEIGSGSCLQDRITIGKNNLVEGQGNMPTLGENVWVGCNAIVYGKITIGDGATICEDTVLTRSIPANCLVRGNPARVIRRDFDNSRLRMDPDAPSSRYLDF
jgi:serine acetyltransferase